MSTSSVAYRFRKDVTIGALAAEEDAAFLRDCFIDTGLLDAILNKDDHRRILLGRTGAGKSALFMRLGEKAHTIVISPDELALDHLSNSELLKQLHDCGISLTPPQGAEVEFEPRLLQNKPGPASLGCDSPELYAPLSERCDSGDREGAARQNEHQS